MINKQRSSLLAGAASWRNNPVVRMTRKLKGNQDLAALDQEEAGPFGSRSSNPERDEAERAQLALLTYKVRQNAQLRGTEDQQSFGKRFMADLAEWINALENGPGGNGDVSFVLELNKRIRRSAGSDPSLDAISSINNQMIEEGWRMGSFDRHILAEALREATIVENSERLESAAKTSTTTTLDVPVSSSRVSVEPVVSKPATASKGPQESTPAPTDSSYNPPSPNDTAPSM